MFKQVAATHAPQIKLWTQCGWHSYSHFVTAEGLYEAPKPSRVRDIILDPPNCAFVIGLNPSGQKHSLFRTRVAHSRGLFPVHFDGMTMTLDRRRFANLLAAFERLCALGFSKDQVVSGRYHPEGLRRAGLSAWRSAETNMAPWRFASPDLLALAAWCGRGPLYFREEGAT